MAEQCGLRAGDAVLAINGRPSDELEHEMAKSWIVQSGHQVRLDITRWVNILVSLGDVLPV